MSDERLLLFSSFTAQPIERPLRVWVSRLDVRLPLFVLPGERLFQLLLDPRAEVITNQGLNVAVIRIEDVMPRESYRADGDGGGHESSLASLRQALETYRQRATAGLLVLIGPPSRMASHPAMAARLSAAERWLADAFADDDRITVMTSEQVLEDITLDYHDDIAYRDGRIPYVPAMYAELARAVARYLHGRFHGERYKVIAVDCDHTLWSGVCGELGPHGITIDEGRRALQRSLVQQVERGRLLCLCSRNHPEDVWSVFQAHAETMPLRREHVAAARIGWGPKHESLRRLADDLHVDIGSFVYLDDDPVMCAEARQLLPEMFTLQVPAETDALPAFVRRLWVFDRFQITDEDRHRTARYRTEQARADLRATAASYDEFIKTLAIDVSMQAMEDRQASRVAQLLIRTTQFNASGLRLSEAELRDGIRQGRHAVCTICVTDRFGDYGLAGCVVYVLEADRLLVTAFSLSCRVLGRGVESRVLDHLRRLTAEAGRSRLVFIYRPTPRNLPVRDCLAASGAEVIGDLDAAPRHALA